MGLPPIGQAVAHNGFGERFSAGDVLGLSGADQVIVVLPGSFSGHQAGEISGRQVEIQILEAV